MKNLKEISCETSICPMGCARPQNAEGPTCPETLTGQVVTLVQRTESIARALNLLMQHHGAREDCRAQMNDQVHLYLDSSPTEKVWLKKTKSLLTYPMSDYLDNERPAEPEGGYFAPKGIFKRWWKSRIAIKNSKNLHLWCSWLQAKRSALPLSDEFVESTYEDHYTSLTRDDPGDSVVIDRIFNNRIFLDVLDDVREDVCQHLVTNDYLCRTSTSACFERSRSGGGQCDELRALASIPPVTFDVVINGGQKYHIVRDVFIVPDELDSMDFTPLSYGRVKKQNCVITNLRPGALDEWCHELREETLKFLISLGNRPLSNDRTVNCTIQAVLEPCKVRVISKGEALPYYNCKPLQEILRRSLAKKPCFRLLKRPFCPTDLLDLADQSNGTDHWFSIDYSAATDGLSWKYSGRILKYLIQDLPDWYQAICLKVLGPHSLHYPTRNGPAVLKGVQKNGQLMGSILSFPILCLANLGVYLLVNEWRQSRWTKKEILNHVLVNGDDMLYAAPPIYWEDHIDIARKVGLEMSVGKAYHHDSYACVNSTSVLLKLSRAFGERVGAPRQIDYLNTGLFFGQRKVQVTDRSTSEETKLFLAAAHMKGDPSIGFSMNISEILKGSLPGKQGEILAKFLELNRDDISAETIMLFSLSSGDQKKRSFYFNRNLFLPVSLGGLGQDCPPGFRYRITRAQRLYARYKIYERLALNVDVSFSYPLPGYEVEKKTPLLNPYNKVVSEKEPLIERGYVPSSKYVTKGRLPKVGVFVSFPNPHCYIL